MKKPRAPRKPARSETPPSKIRRIYAILYEIENEKGMKLSIRNDAEYNYYQAFLDSDWEWLEEEGVCVVNKSYITYLFMNEIKLLLEQNNILVDDFRLEIDPDFGMILSFQENISDQEYEKLLKQYNKRFDEYKEKYKQYKIDMKEYDKYQKQKQIEKLQKELQRLTK